MENVKASIFDPITQKMKSLLVYGGPKGTSNWRIKKIWKIYIEDYGYDPDDILPNVNYGDPRTIIYNPITKRFKELGELKYTTVTGQHIKNFKYIKYNFHREAELIEMFKHIKKMQQESGNYGYVVLYYRDINEPTKILKISINQNNLDTFAEFKARKEQIETGQLEGSDRYQEEGRNYELIRDTLAICELIITGFGKYKQLFNTYGITTSFIKDGYKHGGTEYIEGENNQYKMKPANDCGLLTIKMFIKLAGGELPVQVPGGYVKHYSHIDNILSFISQEKYKKLKIRIIKNAFGLKTKMTELAKRDYIQEDNLKLVELNIKDINIIEYWKNQQSDSWDITIIYDEEDKHFDMLYEEELNNIYLSRCYKIFHKDEKDKFIKWFLPKQMTEKNKIKATFNKYIYVIFDYETIVNYEKFSCMQEYSVSWTFWDEKDLKIINDYDKSGECKELADKIIKDKTFCAVGWDCSTKMIDFLLKNQSAPPGPPDYDLDTAHIYKFISFNGASFDNFILLDYLLRNRDKHELEYSVQDIFYNGNQLLNFRINGTHTCFDIRKHLVGSLDYNCKSFKIKSLAKTQLNHYDIQCIYDHYKDDFFNHLNIPELIEYNKLDCISTGIVFYRYRQALLDIPLTKSYGENLTDFKTIGSIIWNVFQDNQKKKNILLPKLTLKFYQDLQKFKIAGRVEMFNGVMDILEEIMSLDVCSLYPYIMAILNVYYPCGEIVETDEYQKDKIGFYYCDVDQSNLRTANLPPLYAGKEGTENDWNQDIFKDYLFSNIMIEQFLKYGCKVDIKSGFYFTDMIKSTELFGFLLDLMKAKNAQDGYKKTNPELYIAALRETLKLLMNAISGKVIEGLHCQKTTEFSVKKYLKMVEKGNKVNAINMIGDKVFFSYEKDIEDELDKQRPIYLGVMIYDYAKRYMYNMAYAKLGLDKCVYSDTDSVKFKTSDYKDIKKFMETKIVPHWPEVEEVDPRYKTHKLYDPNSKVFGSFENELEENDWFACVQKKAWACCKDKKVLIENGSPAMGFKGVPASAIILQDINGELTEDAKKLYDKNDNLDIIFAQELINTSNNCIFNNARNIDNVYDFFQILLKKHECMVLTSSFRKIVKNQKHTIALDDPDRLQTLNNKIQVQFTIKTLKITDFR